MAKSAIRATAFVLALLILPGETALAQFTSAGKEFVFGFIQNRTRHNGLPTNSNSNVNLSVYIANHSQTQAVNVSISFNGASSSVEYRYNGQTSVTPDNTYTFSIPGASIARVDLVPVAPFRPNALQIMGSNTMERKAFSITANETVSVFAESYQLKSRDASLILPVGSLGSEYYATTYQPSPMSQSIHGGPNEFAVVAVRDNTSINFFLPVAISATISGVTQTVAAGAHSIVLNTGDCLQIQSDQYDLTGTRVWSANGQPFAMFAGNMATKAPNNSSGTWDHVYEQMFPVDTWGCRYITTPLQNQTWDIFRIIAATDNTTVSINGVTLQTGAGPAVFNAGDWIEIGGVAPTLNGVPITNAPLNPTGPLDIEANNLFSVAQYSVSSGINPFNRFHDPFMIVLSPLNQAIDNITFTTMPVIFQAGNLQHYVNIVALTSETATVFIDDDIGAPQPVSALAAWAIVPGTAYSYATLNLNSAFPNASQYRLFMNDPNANGFNAYAYGFDDLEAYGYAAGVKLEPLGIATEDTLICEGETVLLEAFGADEYRWFPEQGLNCTDCPRVVARPAISTIYYLETRNDCGVKLDSVFISVAPAPDIELDPEFTLCGGESVTLDAGGPWEQYEWSTGETEQAITVTESGEYAVRVRNAAGCWNEATVNVVAGELTITLDDVASICEGDSVELDAGAGFATYEWSTGAETRTIVVKQAGDYTVRVEDDAGCVGVATVRVTVEPFIVIDLEPEIFLCDQGTVILDVGADYPEILWSTGQRTRQISVTQPGEYTVEAQNEAGCSGSAQTTVRLAPPIDLQLADEYALCAGDSVTLDAGGNYPGYEWSTGARSRSIVVRQAGEYSVRVVDEFGCATMALTRVELHPIVIDLAETYRICSGEVVALDVGFDFASVTWSNGASGRSVVINEAGDYKVWVENSVGCRDSAAFSVSIEEPVVLPLVPSLSFCAGNSATLDAGAGFESYEWSTGSTDRTIEVDATGDYTVVVTTSFGCSSSATVRVEVFEPPLVEIVRTGILRLCENGDIELATAEPYAEYRWSNGADTRSIRVSQTGIYEVEVVDANGCTGRASIEVEAFDIDMHISADAGGGLEFGRQLVGQSQTRTISIVNNGGEPLHIERVDLRNQSAEYSIDIDRELPAWLPVGEEMTIEAQFIPSFIGVYLDTLDLAIDLPCERAAEAPLHGVGIATVLVQLPDTAVHVGSPLCIPLGAHISFATDITLDFEFETTVRLDVDMYNALGDITEFFVGQRTVGLDREIRLRGNITNLAIDHDTVASICGITLLSQTLTTPIVFDNFVALNPYIEIDTINGSLELDQVCAHNLRPFKLFRPASLNIAPNPADDVIDIIVDNREAGDVSIEVFTMQGVSVAHMGWHRGQNAGAAPRAIALDVSDLAGGVYHVILRAPTGVVAQRLVKR